VEEDVVELEEEEEEVEENRLFQHILKRSLRASKESNAGRTSMYKPDRPVEASTFDSS